MADGVVAHLYPDIALPHLLRHRRRGARAKEAIKHKVAGGGGNVDDAFEKKFWLRGSKNIRIKERNDLFFCRLSMAYFFIGPNSLRDSSLLYFG